MCHNCLPSPPENWEQPMGHPRGSRPLGPWGVCVWGGAHKELPKTLQRVFFGGQRGWLEAHRGQGPASARGLSGGSWEGVENWFWCRGAPSPARPGVGTIRLRPPENRARTRRVWRESAWSCSPSPGEHPAPGGAYTKHSLDPIKKNK